MIQVLSYNFYFVNSIILLESLFFYIFCFTSIVTLQLDNSFAQNPLKPKRFCYIIANINKYNVYKNERSKNMAYNFKEIEKKWQDKWDKEGTFNAKDD